MKPTTKVPKNFSKQNQKVNKQFVETFPKWIPFALMVFTFLLYGRAIYNGITNFDDDYYIVNNPFLKDFSWNGVNAIFSSFYQANYHPFTTLVFFFEYNWFGVNPLPYHFLNVMLHVGNVWLVFKFIDGLSGRQSTAIVAAVLFAIHPLHVESVAWISELKDVLYSCFFLMSLNIYLRYIKSGLLKDYGICLVFFIASLFSKSAAVTLPILLIAIDIYKERKFTTKTILEKLPFILLSLLFGVLAILAQKAEGTVNSITTSYNIVTKLFFQTSALSFYIISFVAPFNLSVMHYYPVLHGGILPLHYYLSFPFTLILIWLMIRKNSMRKEIIFGVFFFLIAISVMLQIVSVGGSALTAERYSYISYIGLFFIIGQWITNIGNVQRKNTVIGIFCLFIIIFSGQTFARISVWNSSATLIEDVIEHNQDVYYGYWMRGNLRRSQDDFQGAYKDYSKAIELSPEGDDSYYNRGNVLDRLGDPKLAIQDYNKAILLNPKLADSYNNRGWTYFEIGNAKSAITDITQAISINPKYVRAYNNRGWVYYKSGDAKSALLDFDKAIELDPKFTTPFYNRAALKTELKDYNGAIADYANLLNLQPKNQNLFMSLGRVYIEMKDTTNACNAWKNAIVLGNNEAKELVDKFCR